MNKFYIFFFILTSFTTSFAQQKIVQGSFKALTDIKDYHVVFDYTDIKVAHFKDEEDFLKDKMGKREGEKAEEFKRKWFADRESNYEPKFIAYFNKRMKKAEVAMAKNPDAQYTLLLKTTWIYPGYNVGIGKEEAKISAVLTVYETANPTNVVLVVSYDKSPGLEPAPDTNAYDPGNRIAGAYEKLAKNFTMQLIRFVK